jgi:hypothetical protein
MRSAIPLQVPKHHFFLFVLTKQFPDTARYGLTFHFPSFVFEEPEQPQPPPHPGFFRFLSQPRIK